MPSYDVVQGTPTFSGGGGPFGGGSPPDLGDLFPWIVGLGGLFSGNPYLALAGLGMGAFSRDLEEANIYGRELAEETRGGIRDVRETVRGIGEDLPAFLAGGRTFGGGGKGPLFDLDRFFRAPAEARRDYFREAFPDIGIPAVDLGLEKTGEDIAALFTGAQQQIGEIPGAVEDIFSTSAGTLERMAREGGLGVTAEDLLTGVDLPETDLSAVETARLATLGRVSGERERLQRQNLAALAQDVGGLESLRRRSASLGFEEAGRRGLEAATIAGQTRMEELSAQEFVSQLQTAAAMKAADINRLLTEGLMTGERQRGLASAQATITSALARGELTAEEANALLRMEATELGEADLNRLIQSENIRNEIGRYFEGVAAETGVPQAELSALLTGLDQYLRQIGQRQGLAGLDLSAVLGGGQIFAPQMMQQIMDYFSAAMGLQSAFNPPDLGGSDSPFNFGAILDLPLFGG